MRSDGLTRVDFVRLSDGLTETKRMNTRLAAVREERL
jgi:hypothetical protein